MTNGLLQSLRRNLLNSPLPHAGSPGGPETVEGGKRYNDLALEQVRALLQALLDPESGVHQEGALGLASRNRNGVPAESHCLDHHVGASKGVLETIRTPALVVRSILEAASGARIRALAGAAAMLLVREHRGTGSFEDRRPLLGLDNARNRLGKAVGDAIADVRDRRFAVDSGWGAKARSLTGMHRAGEKGDLFRLGRENTKGRTAETYASMGTDGVDSNEIDQTGRLNLARILDLQKGSAFTEAVANPYDATEYGIFRADGTDAGTVSGGFYLSALGTLIRLDAGGSTPSALVDGRTMVDHFFTGAATTENIGAFGWALTTANSGAFSAAATIAGRFGIVQCLVTNAAGSKCFIHLGLVGGTGSVYEFGSGKAAYFEATLRINSGGSMTDADVIAFGLADTMNPGEGLFVEFDPSTASTWALHAVAAGDTREQSGTEVAAATFYRVGFTINAAGTSAQLYVDGVAAGDPVTTNLPTNSDALGLVLGLTGSAGSTSISISVDEVSITVET